MQQLQYFVGKVCTVFTSPINREFKTENPVLYPQQLINYFVGIVEAVNENGIMISHDNLKTWVSFRHLVGIAEEEKLNPSNKKDAELIASYKRQEDAPEDKFVNLSAIEKLSNKYAFKKLTQVEATN